MDVSSATISPATLPNSTALAPKETSAPWLVREFSDLRSTLERYDANLTSWQSHGRTHPSGDLHRDFSALAHRFDTARVELGRLRPDAGDLNARLQRDALWISKVAGQIDVMGQFQSPFGRGWSETLDQPISDARAAIDLLLSPPAAA